MSRGSVKLELVPVTLTEARRLVAEHHVHNEAPPSWKFGTGIAADGELVGVAMVGRPAARGLDHLRAVEITRVCITEAGTYRNAASRLYGAACRMAAAGGYRVAYTYTLADEEASSVRAAGFVLDEELEARPAHRTWSAPSRHRYEATLFGPRRLSREAKKRWRRELTT